jgi:adenylate cyclase
MQTKKLPERLKTAIRKQQDSSEVLISAIQLAIVSTFSLLYMLAPKTFSSDLTFAPVPWALALYAMFSLFRFYLAVNNKLPDWMLYLSAVVDIFLLMSLIWSFHLQYDQPASFYLKAPTLLYVFIFISIRALRFDPRFVIATGVSAVIGWVLMVLYVMISDPADRMITRNYIEYMTSNSVLIGAEFDKIISIIIVTAVLALALQRAKILLVDSAIDSSAAKDLSRFVPDAIMQQVVNSEEGSLTGQGKLCETTIIFTDIEGFTSISENLAPDKLIDALNDYFALVSEPIEKYGGVITQFQGDAILATFNAPIANKEHASNAIKAALNIQEILNGKLFGSGTPFNTRIGINSGKVIGGLVGNDNRVSYTVHGDDVNLAARLEQLNKDYNTRIIVSENTLSHITNKDEFKFRELDNVTVRGRQQPIRIYTL